MPSETLSDRDFLDWCKGRITGISIEEGVRLARLAGQPEYFWQDRLLLCDLATLRLDLAEARAQLETARRAIKSVDLDVYDSQLGADGSHMAMELLNVLRHAVAALEPSAPESRAPLSTEDALARLKRVDRELDDIKLGTTASVAGKP